MALDDYNRYGLYKKDSIIEQPPFIDISVNPADKYEEWNEGTSRLDKISLKYYNNPLYDWLILMANPSYLIEFDIPDGTIIRIPFPLERALGEFRTKSVRKTEL